MTKTSKKVLPVWLEDFHDQKLLTKGFYFWMRLLDTIQERNGKKFDSNFQRRNEMCNWVDFTVLMVTFVDFLYRHGYRIQRAEKDADILATARAYHEIEEVWGNIVYKNSLPTGLQLSEEYKRRILDSMPEWIADLAPEEVTKRITP